MLTRERVLIIAQNEIQISHLKKFEAISIIEKLNEENLNEVWKNNKTPAILKQFAGEPTNGCILWEIKELLNRVIIDEIQIETFINKSHEMGFECGDYINTPKYDTSDQRCILCEIASYRGMRNSLAYYNAHTEKEADMIIYESRFFYVTSELGALVQGFLMIVPKEHYFSVAQYDKCIMADYEQVCYDMEKILKGAFGEEKTIIFFEHGSDPSGMSYNPKSIVHAHTHVVVNFKIEKKYLDMVKALPIKDITIAKKSRYFCYQEGFHGQKFVAMDDDVYMQHQYARQIMAKQIGLAPGQYNWRKYDFSENIKATIYRIYTYLKNNTLPIRINERTKSFIEGYERREDFRSI